MAKITAEKIKPMESRVTASASAMAHAQMAHENAEQNHKAQVTLLSKTMEKQIADAKIKQMEANQFAVIVTEARKRLEQLKTEYDQLKLKSASKPDKVPTTMVSK